MDHFYLLLLAFLVSLSPAVANAADTSAERAQACAAAGGTWDTDRVRPKGHCIRDTSAKCAARGGQWTRVCMAQGLACVTPTADAGKACTASSQCEKGCLDVGARPDASGLITGQCRRDDNPCGSFMQIEAGKRVGGVVVD